MDEESNRSLGKKPLVLSGVSMIQEENEKSKIKIQTKQLNLYYGLTHALGNVNIKIYEKSVTALIGPSGCGKSTFLRTLNRMNDTIPGVKIDGEVRIDGVEIYDAKVNVVALRRIVGMVFQKSNPFPKTIFDNVAYGPRVHDIKNMTRLEEIVED